MSATTARPRVLPRPASALLASALLTVPYAAQERAELPAPFEAVAAASHPGTARVVLRPDLHETLRHEPEVTVRGFPLPDGEAVDLVLSQDAWRGTVGVPRVDGVDRWDLYLKHDLTTWKGTVAGHEDSQVYLGFSRHGSHGFLRFADRLVTLENQAGTVGDGRIPVTILREPEGSAITCGTEDWPSVLEGAAKKPGARVGPEGLPEKGFITGVQHARVAVSADYWTYVLAGSDLDAEIAEVCQLLWSVSELYYDELQNSTLNFVMTFPYVEYWTTSNDPWDEPDAGTDNKGDVLDEFEDKWDTIFEDEKVHIALLLCGQTIGGGKASGAGLAAEICEGDFAALGEHSVVGSIMGNMTYPPTQGSNTWEFVVVAHELGHNLGATHTHSLDIDNCDDANPADCPEGTIMSYCHLCPTPGMSTMSNIDLSFHEQNIQEMWTKLDDQDCLPVIGFNPLYVEAGYGGWPDGKSGSPYPSLFEAVRLGTILGGPAQGLYVQGNFPSGLSGEQQWPGLLFTAPLLSGSGIELRGWPGGTGAVID